MEAYENFLGSQFQMSKQNVALLVPKIKSLDPAATLRKVTQELQEKKEESATLAKQLGTA